MDRIHHHYASLPTSLGPSGYLDTLANGVLSGIPYVGDHFSKN